MDWNQRFATADYIFGREASQFVVRQEPRLGRRSRVLCIADGEGRNSVYLAAKGHTVHASDYAPNALAKARRLAADAGVTVEFSEVDLAQWTPVPHQYDAVFAVFFQFAWPAVRDHIFAGLKQVVVPGGRILLHGYTPDQLKYRTGGPPEAERLYTEDLLRQAFEDCTIEELRAYEADLDEGPGHSGRSALIDLITRTKPGAA
jgi:SAM-dependent methyltransferase